MQIRFIIHALFLQKSLLVFYLGEEQLPSQPSHSIRKFEHYFRALCGIRLGILKHPTQQHEERRFSLLFSICAFEEEVYSDSKQQSSLLLTFSPSFSPVVIPQTRQRCHRSSRANTWLSRIMASGCSARWSEEREARQTHAFGLSSAAYCMLLSCGKAQPRCWSRAKCPWLRCCR